MQSFPLLLLTVGVVFFLLTFLVVKRLIWVQSNQLKKERYKSRIGLSSQYEVKKARTTTCWWCSLGRALGSKNEKDIHQIQQLLVGAGYRKESDIGAFYFIKFTMVLVGILVVTMLWSWQGFSPLWIFIVPAVILIIPDRILSFLSQSRLDKINHNLPDFLDMCLICMNAGLSYLVALKRVSHELRDMHPEICYEFDYLLEQIKMGVPRVEALRQFAERNPTKDIQSLVQVLIQNEKLGSSVSEALYEFSRRMYQQREEQMEEKAAKTSAKMAIVIMPFMLLPYIVLMVGERLTFLGGS